MEVWWWLLAIVTLGSLDSFYFESLYSDFLFWISRSVSNKREISEAENRRCAESELAISFCDGTSCFRLGINYHNPLRN